MNRLLATAALALALSAPAIADEFNCTTGACGGGAISAEETAKAIAEFGQYGMVMSLPPEHLHENDYAAEIHFGSTPAAAAYSAAAACATNRICASTPQALARASASRAAATARDAAQHAAANNGNDPYCTVTKGDLSMLTATSTPILKATMPLTPQRLKASCLSATKGRTPRSIALASISQR